MCSWYIRIQEARRFVKKKSKKSSRDGALQKFVLKLGISTNSKKRVQIKKIKKDAIKFFADSQRKKFLWKQIHIKDKTERYISWLCEHL